MWQRTWLRFSVAAPEPSEFRQVGSPLWVSASWPVPWAHNGDHCQGALPPQPVAEKAQANHGSHRGDAQMRQLASPCPVFAISLHHVCRELHPQAFFRGLSRRPQPFSSGDFLFEFPSFFGLPPLVSIVRSHCLLLCLFPQLNYMSQRARNSHWVLEPLSWPVTIFWLYEMLQICVLIDYLAEHKGWTHPSMVLLLTP